MLLAAGRLSAFRARWGKELGDCHAVAGDLFRGLIEAGSPFTWSWMVMARYPYGAHSFLQLRGCAIDGSNGKLYR